MHPQLTKALDVVRGFLNSDSAYTTGVRQYLFPEAVTAQNGPPLPCPSADTITAIQTAIFDNWPDGRRMPKHPNRYGVALEVWTKPAAQIRVTHRRPNHDFKSNIMLRSGHEMTKFLKVLRKPRRQPLAPSFLALLEEVAGQLHPDQLIGLINTTVRDDHGGHDRGTYYHDHQIVIAWLSDAGEVERMTVVLGDDLITLNSFSPIDAAGNRHGGCVAAQSRTDRCGFSNCWATDEMSSLI